MNTFILLNFSELAFIWIDFLIHINKYNISRLEGGDELQRRIVIGSLEDSIQEMDFMKRLKWISINFREFEFNIENLNINSWVFLSHFNLSQIIFLLSIVFNISSGVKSLVMMPNAIIIKIMLFILILAHEVGKS